MRKINWFDAHRSLSNDVVDFMRVFVWKAELNEKFARKQAELDSNIAGLENLRGSISEDKIPAMREAYLARKAELDIQHKEQLEKEATYTLSESDQKLKKALSAYARGKKDATNPDIAIVSWFLDHGLDVRETGIIDEILNGAGENLHVKTLVRTNGTVVTRFNAGNAFKMVFAKSYEHMVNAGTIKAAQIPELIAEKYAPKAKKSSKKEAK